MNRLIPALPVVCLSACSGPSPEPAQAEFQVVEFQRTVDATQQTLRIRWIIQQVPTDSLPGLNGRRYTQFKTFTLPDTLTYRPGHRFLARKTLLDYRQQTAWQTPYEWFSVGPTPPGYTPNPEVELDAITPR